MHYLSTSVRFLAARLFQIRSPLIVGWALTNRCNIKCRYCNRWKHVSAELDLKNILNIISTLAKMGTYKINFSGGEPLLREDLNEIIKFSISKGIKVSVNSNGILVPDKIYALKGIDTLGLSLEGPEEIHDYLRCKGGYEAVIKATKFAQNIGIKVIFNTLITRKNFNHIEYILETCERLKTRVMFSLIESIPFSSEETKSLMPLSKDYKKAIEKLIKEKMRRNKSILNSLSALYFFRNWPNVIIIYNCAAGLIHCRIEPDGHIYICGSMVSKNNSVNCLGEGFKKAFFSLKRVYQCKGCWCGNRVEMNKIFSLKLDSILNTLNSEFKNRC